MDAMKTLLTAPARQGVSECDISPIDGLSLSAEQVFHDYAPRVYSMARRMVASDFDADDVTQDVLLQVVRKLPSFRGDAAFPTWLHRVTVNAALSHRRKQATRQEHGMTASLDAQSDSGTVATLVPHPGLPPDDQLVGDELKQLINRAVEALPEAYREVFVLSDLEGLPNSEIAERLEMSLAAVKSRLHRARAMLRDALSPHLAS